MTHRIKALSEYRPRIAPSRPCEMAELARYLADRTGLHETQVRYVLGELKAGVLNFNRAGRAVRLEGLGTFAPGIELDGKIHINHRPDITLTYALNTPGFFEGEIIHSENIGKEMADLVALWNEDHPTDPLPM
jgi:hypothetical protein